MNYVRIRRLCRREQREQMQKQPGGFIRSLDCKKWDGLGPCYLDIKGKGDSRTEDQRSPRQQKLKLKEDVPTCFLKKTLLREKDDGLFPIIVLKKTKSFNISFVLSYRILHSYIQLLSTSSARAGFPDPLFQPMKEGVGLSYHQEGNETFDCTGTECS